MFFDFQKKEEEGKRILIKITSNAMIENCIIKKAVAKYSLF
jgi:hypothetical protein